MTCVVSLLDNRQIQGVLLSNYNGTISRTSPVFRLIHSTAHAAAARQTTQSPTTEPGNDNGTMSRTSPVFRLIHRHSTRSSGQTNNTVANYGTWDNVTDVSRIQIDTYAQHTLQRPDKQHSRQLRNLVTTTGQYHGPHAVADRQTTQSPTTEPGNYNGTMSRTSPVFRLIHSTAHAVAARQTTQSPTTEPDNYKGTMSRTSPVFRLIHMHSTRCSGQTNNTVANYGT
ncbi:hypothetical protein J6590_047945 [Homalodisca vitripennis]|nr:hypothetical protein J6590_047945 [Homalodisca vitripennis]